MTGISLDTILAWLITMSAAVGIASLRIGLVLAIGYVAIRFVRLGLHQLERVMIVASDKQDQESGTAAKRAATLTGILRTIALSAIWAIIIIESLQLVGLDIAPILAGAGILGLAVGFGAQNLVRDLISGFFIILEDQVRLGDVAVINGTGGAVETITFRTISLRDFSGVVHIFPNGGITTLSNMTKDWSAFVLDMGVAYREDTDRVVEVMRTVGEGLRQDQAFGSLIIEPIEIVGVENFADSAVTIRARIKTKPAEQWKIGREYRRRLKKAFDAQGIDIPFPMRTLLMGETDQPLKVEVIAGLGLGKS
ncbi:MAG: mechanosensitive ion channel family protein [Nitrospira sp.]|nr:mechanosensitive ion channel family protein [Nitrospira sp.]MCW5796117.1 mechanosensitive ion channel family protein [Nitrospira sp.]